MHCQPSDSMEVADKTHSDAQQGHLKSLALVWCLNLNAGTHTHTHAHTHTRARTHAEHLRVKVFVSCFTYLDY